MIGKQRGTAKRRRPSWRGLLCQNYIYIYIYIQSGSFSVYIYKPYKFRTQINAYGGKVPVVNTFARS